jgi:hypothetical protein
MGKVVLRGIETHPLFFIDPDQISRENLYVKRASSKCFTGYPQVYPLFSGIKR